MMMPVGLGQDDYAPVLECSEMGMVEDPSGNCVPAATPTESIPPTGPVVPELPKNWLTLPPGGAITGATVSYPTWDIYRLATGALVKILSTATPPVGATLVSRSTAPVTVACKSGVDTTTGKCKDVMPGLSNTYLLAGGAVIAVLLVALLATGRR
jgi:hypothetical protein